MEKPDASAGWDLPSYEGHFGIVTKLVVRLTHDLPEENEICNFLEPSQTGGKTLVDTCHQYQTLLSWLRILATRSYGTFHPSRREGTPYLSSVAEVTGTWEISAVLVTPERQTLTVPVIQMPLIQSCWRRVLPQTLEEGLRKYVKSQDFLRVRDRMRCE